MESPAIVAVCLGCKKRVVSERAEWDPPNAVEMHSWCADCGSDMDVVWYYDAEGNEIS
jgi:hypothetical protein